MFAAPVTVLSQDASQQAISQLQQEIAKREALDRDESMPADLKAQNRSLLDKRRTELVTAIQARITALQKYIESLGSSATAEEKAYVQNSLKTLSSVTTSVSGGVPAETNRNSNPTPEATGSNSNLLRAATVPSSSTMAEARSSTGLIGNTLNTSTATLNSTVKVRGTVTVKNAQFYKEGDVSLALKTEYETTKSSSIPLKEATVMAEKIKPNGDREFVTKTITEQDGTYTLTVPVDQDYIISATDGDFKTEQPVSVAAADMSGEDLELLVRPLGEYSRAIVGFEQAAASAANSTQKFFFDLTLSTPLPFGAVDPFFGRRSRLWGTARVTSVPQQINSGVATFATGFAQQVGALKVNEVAQGIEYLVGTEVRLTEHMDPFGSFGRTTTNRFSVAFIAGAGASTPLNPKATLEIFKVFPDAPGLPTIPTGKEFIAFVSPDRDRFFRQYYGGIRLQTYYFDYRNPDIPLKRFPAVFDVTFGQNEAVTGGRLRGGVLRIEGFYPLPYEGMKFINLFGTALMRLRRTNITDPLILEVAPTGTTIPATNVFIQTVPQINRDYYRIGVGIDFMSLINRWRAAAQ